MNLKNRKIKILILLLFFAGALYSLRIYSLYGFTPINHDIQKQLDKIYASPHKTRQLRKFCANQSTYEKLIKYKSVKFKLASDIEGGNSLSDRFYRATINEDSHYGVNIKMNDKGFIHKLFPSYSLETGKYRIEYSREKH